jgi:hypothetical protein
MKLAEISAEKCRRGDSAGGVSPGDALSIVSYPVSFERSIVCCLVRGKLPCGGKFVSYSLAVRELS